MSYRTVALTLVAFSLGAIAFGDYTKDGFTYWNVVWGCDSTELLKPPSIVFFKQRECECGEKLPAQCYLFGLVSSKALRHSDKVEGENEVVAGTLLDYKSNPKWVVHNGIEMPDPEWVLLDHHQDVDTIISAGGPLPPNFTLRGWLDAQKEAWKDKAE